MGLLQVQFFLSWAFAGGSDEFRSDYHYLPVASQTKGEATVAIAASGPSSEVPFILETVLLGISQAEKTIHICTPYFIPPDPLVSALVIAAAQGVEVELILPARSDSFIVQHASFSYLKPLLERGVKVYLYKKGFLHSKTITIDGSLAFVGTVNMDTRSFYLNFEITSVLYDPGFCSALEHSFEQDKQSSQSLTLSYWQSRPMVHRGFDSVCRLVAPLL